MLNVKSKKLNPFKQKKNERKAGILTTVARSFLQPSVAFWPDFNQNLVLYRMNVISGR